MPGTTGPSMEKTPMNKADAEKALDYEYKYATNEVLRYGARMAAVERIRPILEALLAIPGHEDVERISIGGTWDTKLPYVRLYLKESARDSYFVREAAKALHVDFKKEQASGSLDCVTDILGVAVTIANYLPADCRVEYVEEFVPSRHERWAKVICNDGKEAASA